MAGKNNPPETALTEDELIDVAKHQESLRVAIDTLRTLVNELAHEVVLRGNTGLDATLIAEDLKDKAEQFLELLQQEPEDE